MVDSAPGPVVIVGAGIAGVACAQALRGAGAPVRLVDRGRRIGGRMASRRLDGRVVDLGASYFTLDPEGVGFAQVVEDWQARGLARRWTDTLTALEIGGDGQIASAEAKTGPMRWSAEAGLRSLVEDLASGLEVVESEVVGPAGLAAHADGAAAVVLAMPDPQAVRLLELSVPGQTDVAARLTRSSEPILALAASWPERTWDALGPNGRFDGAFVNGDPVLSWVADDGRRRGDGAPVLVAHSTPEFAGRHLAEPQAAAPELSAAVRRVFGLAQPTSWHLHRWSLARPTGERAADVPEPFLLVSGGDLPAPLLGVCGDGWGAEPKVATAWRSGDALGRQLGLQLGRQLGTL